MIGLEIEVVANGFILIVDYGGSDYDEDDEEIDNETERYVFNNANELLAAIAKFIAPPEPTKLGVVK